MNRSPLINKTLPHPRTSMRLDPLHWWFFGYLQQHEDVVGRATEAYPSYPRTAAVRAYLLRTALTAPPIIPPEYWKGHKL